MTLRRETGRASLYRDRFRQFAVYNISLDNYVKMNKKNHEICTVKKKCIDMMANWRILIANRACAHRWIHLAGSEHYLRISVLRKRFLPGVTALLCDKRLFLSVSGGGKIG